MMTQSQRSAMFSNNNLTRFYVMGGGALDISQGTSPWPLQTSILSGDIYTLISHNAKEPPKTLFSKLECNLFLLEIIRL